MTTHPWRYAVDHFLLLPIGGLIGLVWANTGPESYFTAARVLAFPVNEIGMALFFALMTQEVVEATMPHGTLHTWRKWTLPVAAAAGAIVGAAVTYSLYINLKYELVLAGGWPVAAAIDLAFAYFVVKSIFRRHPAVSFLVVLAIVTDVVAMLAVASRQAFVEVRPGGAALMIAAIGAAVVLRRWKVRSFWPYLLACGPLSWWALYLDGFHPALALVPIVPFVPHAPRNLELFADAPHGAHDSPSHLEHVFGHPIQVILFLFGLVNAGVLLSGYGTGTWALLTASLVGKPLGILAFTALAVSLGLHLPARLHWRDLVVVAIATSGVFTFGLFFATSAFPIGPILGELKMGAIATGIGVPLAFAAAWFLRVGHFAANGHHHHRTSHTDQRTHHAGRRVAVSVLLAAAVAAPAIAHVPAADRDVARVLANRRVDDDLAFRAQFEVVEPTVQEEQALEQFDRALDDYVALHRRIDRLLPPPRMFDDAEEMVAARDTLREAIVNARRDARGGELFTPLVSAAIRARLRRAILWHGHDPADILADNRAERLPGSPMPEVNAPFPWELGAAMWPTLLRVLPELSEELEYRFVDRDLVLIDMHANLVVDILVDALPPASEEVSSMQCAITQDAPAI
jgi:NhaA family Na+:H+ antiporter